MYYYFLIAVVALLVVWAFGSYLFVRNIEEPVFTVVEKRRGYEIRDYTPYLVAETDVSGGYKEASSEGFRRIADYIFGNNTSRVSIAMTAPVLENKTTGQSSEKIAMTVPVIDVNQTEGVRTISFVLPSEYTLETLPIPNNPQVRITPVGARRVAVLTFTWYPTADRIDAKKRALQALLEKDGQIIDGEMQVARYNPPLSMPLTIRNEIIVPIK